MIQILMGKDQIFAFVFNISCLTLFDKLCKRHDIFLVLVTQKAIQ